MNSASKVRGLRHIIQCGNRHLLSVVLQRTVWCAHQSGWCRHRLRPRGSCCCLLLHWWAIGDSRFAFEWTRAIKCWSATGSGNNSPTTILPICTAVPAKNQVESRNQGNHSYHWTVAKELNFFQNGDWIVWVQGSYRCICLDCIQRQSFLEEEVKAG